MTSKLDGCCLFSVLLHEPTTGSEQVPPEFTEEYAMGHDRNVLQCLSSILQVEELPPHSPRGGFLALDLGRFGCWWQFEDPARCSLGQLGRLSGDDQAETSWERRGHHHKEWPSVWGT